MPKYHELKTWPIYFSAIVRGDKTFEVRLNDRGFQPGDYLILKEYDPQKKEYTGRVTVKYVQYILNDSLDGIDDGYVIMSLFPA